MDENANLLRIYGMPINTRSLLLQLESDTIVRSASDLISSDNWTSVCKAARLRER